MLARAVTPAAEIGGLNGDEASTGQIWVPAGLPEEFDGGEDCDDRAALYT